MKELKGKTAIISGGAEGIGLGVAREMGRQGMNVVLADINARQLQLAEKSLQEQGIAVLTVALDAAEIAQWENVAERAIERFGKVHMLVNNAGVSGTPGAVDTMGQKCGMESGIVQCWHWRINEASLLTC